MDDSKSFKSMAEELYDKYFSATKANNYIGDPPDWLQNNPFMAPNGMPSTGLPPYSSPPIQWPQILPPAPNSGMPGTFTSAAKVPDDFEALTARVAELELKVYTLMTILHYITGVKNGTQPEDNISEEEKPDETHA